MKTSKWLVVVLSACCTAGLVNLEAQTVVSGTGLDLNGGSSFSISTQSGTVSRLLWLPDKGALRFGRFSATPAASDSGQDSIAGGFGAKASGAGGIALGYGSLASGDGSIAIGGDADNNDWGSPTASNYGSIAIGMGSAATEAHALAIGSQSVAEGEDSAALGYRSKAWADSSFASGIGSQAFDVGATAVGVNAFAYSESSLALGSNAEADGKGSVAIGQAVYTSSAGAIAVGTNNQNTKKDGVSMPSPEEASPDDPIFEIGAGDLDLGIRHNAFTVFRDGTVRLTKAAGGISMGSFGGP